MELKEKLRRLRTEYGVSQEEAAERLDVSRQTIGRWEAGACLPTTENLMRLSALYGVPLDEWMGEEWTPPARPALPEAPEGPEEPPRAAAPQKSAGRRGAVLILLAALLVAAGILCGALLFRERPRELTHSGELESEVIDVISVGSISFLPHKD